MEQVEVVDENLNILYTVSKEEAHAKGLLHKTVIAEVVNSKGGMLLVRQSGHKQDAGQFVSPVGGHVSSGETDEQALKRETKEEIGIENFQYRHLGNFIFNRFTRGVQENHYFMVYEIRSDRQPILSDEVAGYKWFSKVGIAKELNKNQKMFGDAFIPIWEKYYELPRRF